MISAEKTNAPATRDGPHPRDTMVQSLQRELDGLKAEGLYRWLRQIDGPQGPRVHVDGREAIHFAGSDYLGLACHPRLKKAACQATLRYGCGVAAARLISGNHELYPQLEERLARFKQAVAALTRLLEQGQSARRRLIVVDGLYSMDGDVAPLQQIVELAERYNCMTMVDDSHGTGVLGESGRGTAEATGVLGRIDIETGSLAKTLGGFGAYVVGRRTVIDYLINRARPFIFTCALPPAVVAAVIEALTIVEQEPERRERLRDNIRYMRSGLREIGFDVNLNGTQIIPLVVGEPERTMRFCRELLNRGVFAQGIRYPSIPRGTERIRLTVTASHSRIDLDRALTALAEAGRSLQLV